MRRASLGAESGSFKGLNHETSTHKRINRGANSDRQVAKRETRKAGTQAGTQDPQGKAIETQLEIGESRHMTFTYYINLDERGEFYADVRNEKEKTVFEIQGYEIFEDGFMSHKNDVTGLQEYLRWIDIIPSESTILKA